MRALLHREYAMSVEIIGTCAFGPHGDALLARIAAVAPCWRAHGEAYRSTLIAAAVAASFSGCSPSTQGIA